MLPVGSMGARAKAWSTWRFGERMSELISWESFGGFGEKIQNKPRLLWIYPPGSSVIVWTWIENTNTTGLDTGTCNTVKANPNEASYSSLLTKPVPLGSKSLKAARMVSSGSVPLWNSEETQFSIFDLFHWAKFNIRFDRTVEFLPKKGQEDGEVDGALPFI